MGDQTSDVGVTENVHPQSGVSDLVDLGDGTSLQPIPATLRQNSNKENSPGNRAKGRASGRAPLGAVPEGKPAPVAAVPTANGHVAHDAALSKSAEAPMNAPGTPKATCCGERAYHTPPPPPPSPFLLFVLSSSCCNG